MRYTAIERNGYFLRVFDMKLHFFSYMCKCIHSSTGCVTKNPDKSNNFFKQNVFNEKLNITWHLEDLCRAQLFDISLLA